PLPDNLNLSHPTHTERFNVYVPFDDDNDDEDFDSRHPEVLPGKSVAPDFGRFLNGPAAQGPQAALTGPHGPGSSLPSAQFWPSPSRSTTPPASAPGGVRVVPPLDGNSDPRLFMLGAIQLGDLQIHVPASVTNFQHDFDFTASKGFILRVSA